MLPGKAKLFKCPHCGYQKPLLNLRSGNTFEGRQWSDARTYFPMWPEISPVQRCPECGHYWFAGYAEASPGECRSEDTGDLDLNQARESLEELWTPTMNDEDKVTLLLNFVHVYNDTFFRYETSAIPSDEDKELFDTVVLSLYNCSFVYINGTLKAELLREAGRFRQCIDFLDSSITISGFIANIRKEIKNRAQVGDSRVFDMALVQKPSFWKSLATIITGLIDTWEHLRK